MFSYFQLENAAVSTPRKPSYLLHQATGQARAIIDGKTVYLGEYGSPKSRERYDALITEWFQRQGNIDAIQLTVDDLSLIYLDHARKYYQKNGKPTREVGNIRAALRPLIRLLGPTRLREFGPKMLRQVQDALSNQRDSRIKSKGKARKVSRQYVNAAMTRIKRMFRWGVGQELVPVTIYQAIQAVEGLRKGRTEAREASPVTPVDDAEIDAALPHLAPQVATMVELQRLTGMRPNEVVALRAADIAYRTDGLWTYRPKQHKNDHHEIDRVVFLGPKAQAILRPWLERDSEAYCFSPREAVEHLQRLKRMQRKTRVQPSQADRSNPKPKRQPGVKYSTGTYRQAISRACLKAGIPAWSPNQIRHRYATIIRAQYGLEAAQVTLGHAKADVTQIYSERDLELAARIVREVG